MQTLQLDKILNKKVFTYRNDLFYNSRQGKVRKRAFSCFLYKLGACQTFMLYNGSKLKLVYTIDNEKNTLYNYLEE